MAPDELSWAAPSFTAVSSIRSVALSDAIRIRRSTTSGSLAAARSVNAAGACPTTSHSLAESSPWNGSGTPSTSQRSPAFGNSSCQPPRYSESQSRSGVP